MHCQLGTLEALETKNPSRVLEEYLQGLSSRQYSRLQEDFKQVGFKQEDFKQEDKSRTFKNIQEN